MKEVCENMGGVLSILIEFFSRFKYFERICTLEFFVIEE
jgi:hypothetical protein